MAPEYGSPELSEAARWLAIAGVMTVVGVVLVVIFSGLTEAPSIVRRCEDRGGVLVRSAEGPWVCVKEAP